MKSLLARKNLDCSKMSSTCSSSCFAIDLKFLANTCNSRDFTLFLHPSYKNVCKLGSFNFNGVLVLDFLGRCLINILTALLNHFCGRSFQITPLVEANDIFTNKVPLLDFKINLHNCCQDAPCGNGISSISGLFFK